MKIADLAFLQNICENELVLGSAGVAVTAFAIAEGNSSYTLASADTSARPLPLNGSIAIGQGFARATGDNRLAGIAVAGEGDIVVGTTKSKDIPRLNTTIAVGAVVAIDKPSIKL